MISQLVDELGTLVDRLGMVVDGPTSQPFHDKQSHLLLMLFQDAQPPQPHEVHHDIKLSVVLATICPFPLKSSQIVVVFRASRTKQLIYIHTLKTN